jgi:BASS family bile acid:Na+ symporter
MQILRRICLAIAGAGFLLLVAGLALHNPVLWQPGAAACCVGLAIGLGAIPPLRGYQFTAWIIAAVVVAMIYPARILHVGSVSLSDRRIILVIVQAVMFGMGTQMSLKDFAGVVKMPWGVFVGIFCHFTIMPLVGFALAVTLRFPPEIAAGIVLIGSCSSGLASNVMVYIARANLALSITIVSLATLVAPVMTPLWMKLLANQMVEVKFLDMMMEIIKIVLVPIGAAVLHDYLKHASARGRWLVLVTAAVGTAWLAFLFLGGWHYLAASIPQAAIPWLSILGFVLGAAVVGVAYHWMTLMIPRLDRWMPTVSMFGIIYFTAVTTAAGRDNLLQVGGLLFLAAVIHNTAGFCFGYGLSRVMGLDRTSARTVAMEVGLQNGGMATGLASSMGKLATVGLAAAIFSPWMNVSGSILANYWRRRPVPEDIELQAGPVPILAQQNED